MEGAGIGRLEVGVELLGRWAGVPPLGDDGDRRGDVLDRVGVTERAEAIQVGRVDGDPHRGGDRSHGVHPADRAAGRREEQVIRVHDQLGCGARAVGEDADPLARDLIGPERGHQIVQVDRDLGAELVGKAGRAGERAPDRAGVGKRRPYSGVVGPVDRLAAHDLLELRKPVVGLWIARTAGAVGLDVALKVVGIGLQLRLHRPLVHVLPVGSRVWGRSDQTGRRRRATRRRTESLGGCGRTASRRRKSAAAHGGRQIRRSEERVALERRVVDVAGVVIDDPDVGDRYGRGVAGQGRTGARAVDRRGKHAVPEEHAGPLGVHGERLGRGVQALDEAGPLPELLCCQRHVADLVIGADPAIAEHLDHQVGLVERRAGLIDQRPSRALGQTEVELGGDVVADVVEDILLPLRRADAAQSQRLGLRHDLRRRLRPSRQAGCMGGALVILGRATGAR